MVGVEYCVQAVIFFLGQLLQLIREFVVVEAAAVLQLVLAAGSTQLRLGFRGDHVAAIALVNLSQSDGLLDCLARCHVNIDTDSHTCSCHS